MKDLADAYRMDLRGSLAVLAAVLASLSGICALTHTGGLSGPVERSKVILGGGSLETDVQMP